MRLASFRARFESSRDTPSGAEGVKLGFGMVWGSGATVFWLRHRLLLLLPHIEISNPSALLLTDETFCYPVIAKDMP